MVTSPAKDGPRAANDTFFVDAKLFGMTNAEQNKKKRERRKERRNSELRSRYPTIHDWTTIVDELGALCLTGHLHNDPRFPNGTFVTTSPLESINHLLGRTARSIYYLGAPSTQYLAYRQDQSLGPISCKKYWFGRCD